MRVGNLEQGLTILDLFIYTQFTATQTIHLHTTQENFVQYFDLLPEGINQKSANIPYKQLTENYEPKQEGVWRNVATFHKSLAFDAAREAFTSAEYLRQSNTTSTSPARKD